MALCLTRGAAAEEPSDAGRVLVGVNYFAGWWESLPNKWHGKGWSTNEPDWRPQFAERVPLLGEYNDQPTMDREIAAAADHGVDFFSILWYFPRPGTPHEETGRLLNRGLDCFLASKNSGRMRFMIEYCNATVFRATNDVEWASCVETWVAAMRHPSYLRVDGRPIFKVHGADQFLRTHDRDPDLCRRRLEALRASARSAGLGEVCIGGGIMAANAVKPAHPVAKLFDFTATYMSVPDAGPQEEEYPYSVLAAVARAGRASHAEDPIPWVPYLAAGWNPRPWTHPKADDPHRTFFRFPAREEWAAELRAIKDDFKKYPRLGLPRADGTCQPAFTIYAWNEFGEGGIVAPTRGEGHMRLEAIRENF